MADLDFSPPISVVAGLLAIQIGYWLCAVRFRDRFVQSSRVSDPQLWMFAEGVAVLLLALASPLHDLSDRFLFSAHMVQHLLMILVAVPLLLAGTPAWLFEEFTRTLHLDRVFRVMRNPFAAYAFFNVVFTFSHLPSIYERALSSEMFHAGEHLLYLAAAIVMWMPVLSPSGQVVRRFPEIGQVLYLFLQTIPASLLGAFISGAGSPLYPTYAVAPRIVDLSALADQQVGALLMWVGTGIYFLLASGFVFFRWASREEAINRRPNSGHSFTNRREPLVSHPAP